MSESRANSTIPLVYRVLHASVQRVAVSIKNLSSFGAFIIVVEEDKQVIVWLGSQCVAEDAELANTIAETIVKRDFRESDDAGIPTVIEGEESSEILEQMLDLLWSTSSIYYSKASAKDRKKDLLNSSVSVGLVENGYTAGTYEFQETAFAHPDVRGVVPRVTFVPIEMETIAYVNVGDHWDIWCARAVPDDEIERVMVFVRSSVATQLALVDNVATRQANVLAQYVHLIRQGEESTLFRRPMKIFTDYEPPGRCAPRPDPAPRMRKEADKKTQQMFAKQAAGIVQAKRDARGAKQVDEDDEEEEIGFGGGDLAPTSMAPPKFGLTLNSHNGPVPMDEEVEEEQVSTSVDFWSAGAAGTVVSNNSNHRPVSYESSSSKKANGALGFDRHSITPDMLQVIEEFNDKPDVRKRVVDEAAQNPKSLIGYQVEIDDGVYAGVFVVTEVKKNLLQQTLFHLCALDKDEFWIRLRRNNKSGKAFRPLRRVVKMNFATAPAASSPTTPNGGNQSQSQLQSQAGMNASSEHNSPVPLDADDREAAEYALILNEYVGDDDDDV